MAFIMGFLTYILQDLTKQTLLLAALLVSGDRGKTAFVKSPGSLFQVTLGCAQYQHRG